jgi:hypothetical protein
VSMNTVKILLLLKYLSFCNFLWVIFNRFWLYNFCFRSSHIYYCASQQRAWLQPRCSDSNGVSWCLNPNIMTLCWCVD